MEATAKRDSVKAGDALPWLLLVGGLVVGVNLYNRTLGTPGKNAFVKRRILAAPSWFRSMVSNTSIPVPQSHIDWFHANDARISTAVQRFYDARGVLVDADGQAVAAVQSMPNPFALAAFVEEFYNRSGYTPSSYGLSFLSDSALGQIADHVRNIRADNPYNAFPA